jgi:taurine dioxygenase
VVQSNVQFAELPGPLGVEVRGIDLRQPLHDSLVHDLRAAYAEHLLVLFRDQQLSPADQERAVGLFGPVLDEFGDGKTHSIVSNVSDDNIGGPGDQELIFHSDMTNTGCPASGLSLYAMEITSGAANTRYANTQRAYRMLPDDLRQEADTLTVVDVARDPEQYRNSPGLLMSDSHPAVIAHPETGVGQLYCNVMWSNQVVGMDASAARQVLDKLFSYLYASANVYEHEWKTGDLIVWDNVAVQHSRRAVEPGCRRTLRRVAIGYANPRLVAAMQSVRDHAPA